MKLLLENWRKYLKESVLSDQLTDTMHEKWLQGYKAEKGEAPRFKPVPLESGHNPEEILQTYEKTEIIDGVLQQDINQSAENIVPSLKHKLNGAPSIDYAAAIEKTEINNPDDVEVLASEFHNIWIKHNAWQEESNPSLFVPYENLPPDEKRKDLDQLKIALDLHYRDIPEIQQYFEEVYSRT